MKVVILGATGMLGSDLKNAFPDSFAFGKADLDITNSADLKEIIKINPEIVINAAAYAKVDEAEDNKVEAFRVNAFAVRNLAKVCRKLDCTMVHYSTDYVFDGNKREYDESAEKNPVNVYGISKSKGEDFLMSELEKHYIIRSGWLFGKNGKNFVDTIINIAKSKDSIDVVNDQFGKPTYTKDLSEKTKEILKNNFGIYHITNEGVCSWYEFAKEIIKQRDLNVKVNTITSVELKRKAKRPRHSVLKNTKTSLMRNWKFALEEYLG